MCEPQAKKITKTILQNSWALRVVDFLWLGLLEMLVNKCCYQKHLNFISFSWNVKGLNVKKIPITKKWYFFQFSNVVYWFAPQEGFNIKWLWHILMTFMYNKKIENVIKLKS
jgi:hypothetical protein